MFVVSLYDVMFCDPYLLYSPYHRTGNVRPSVLLRVASPSQSTGQLSTTTRQLPTFVTVAALTFVKSSSEVLPAKITSWNRPFFN